MFGRLGRLSRAGGRVGHLVAAHGVRPQRRAGLARLLVGEMQGGGLLDGQRGPLRPLGDVDLQPCLGFVLQKLPVVRQGDPALVEPLVVLADPGDLELVRDVVALDFHRLYHRKGTNSVVIFFFMNFSL